MKKLIIISLIFIISTSSMAQDFYLGGHLMSFWGKLRSPYDPSLPAPFDIVIQDSMVIMKKKHDAVSLNISIIKHVKEKVSVYRFSKYVRIPCCYHSVSKDGKIRYCGFPGLYYYLEDINGNRIEHNNHERSIDCENWVVRVDTTRMKYNRGWKLLEDHEQISLLCNDTTHISVYPVIKFDYWYKDLVKDRLPKCSEFYLTLFYVFPSSDFWWEEQPLFVVSNKVKLIIK